MQLTKLPETIAAARARLQREMDYLQSADAILEQTDCLLRLLGSYAPDDPAFERKVALLRAQRNQPYEHWLLLEAVRDN